VGCRPPGTDLRHGQVLDEVNLLSETLLPSSSQKAITGERRRDGRVDRCSCAHPRDDAQCQQGSSNDLRRSIKPDELRCALGNWPSALQCLRDAPGSPDLAGAPTASRPAMMNMEESMGRATGSRAHIDVYSPARDLRITRVNSPCVSYPCGSSELLALATHCSSMFKEVATGWFPFRFDG
jgi:hypothetical protein